MIYSIHQIPFKYFKCENCSDYSLILYLFVFYSSLPCKRGGHRHQFQHVSVQSKRFSRQNYFIVSERFKRTWWGCTEDRCLPSAAAAPPAPSAVHSLCSVLLFCLAGAAADFSPWLTGCLCPWTHSEEKRFVYFFCFVFENKIPGWQLSHFRESWNKSVQKRWKPLSKFGLFTMGANKSKFTLVIIIQCFAGCIAYI